MTLGVARTSNSKTSEADIGAVCIRYSAVRVATWWRVVWGAGIHFLTVKVAVMRSDRPTPGGLLRGERYSTHMRTKVYSTPTPTRHAYINTHITLGSVVESVELSSCVWEIRS